MCHSLRQRFRGCRHVYALARWGYARGIKLYELYNEPDLDGCLQVGTSVAYLEHYMLRARAVRNCYEDLNAGGWQLRALSRARMPRRYTARVLALVRLWA
jgi:hypothetical protein